MRDNPVVLCQLTSETKQAVIDFAEALKEAAPAIGARGLAPEEFTRSGIFHGAIERIRGQRAATMFEKRAFVDAILNRLQQRRYITSWRQSASSDRHDYEVKLRGNRVAVIETKGCLDGNNTNIFERPPHADEFVIWSLCQNAGADPGKNAWSGIHTRLSAEIIHRGQGVDGLIIWDMLCGTVGRPCPKLRSNPERKTSVASYAVPPPCIYLFPCSIPDPRNNPTPPVWKLSEVGILEALHKAFGGDGRDVTEVHIRAGMRGATVTRVTTLLREGAAVFESRPTLIKRAKR